MLHTDISERLSVTLASTGAWITAYAASNIIFNEMIRLFSSCLIAALGAIIGYYITKELKRRDAKRERAVRQWDEYWNRVEQSTKYDVRSTKKKQDAGKDQYFDEEL
jgi:membrane protein YqaA with SNARE-associated domain